jgi:hypothetical protein
MRQWERESHKGIPALKGEVAFWRHRDKGFVDIDRIEKGAPAWDIGKYMVEINAPLALESRVFKTQKEARKYAKELMRDYSKRYRKYLKEVM